MSIYKRSATGPYWFKFYFHGQLIQESSKVTSATVARQIEAARRTQLAKGEVGIKRQIASPALRNYIDDVFLPYIASTAKKASSARYYRQGCDLLKKCPALAGVRIDQITDNESQAFSRSLARLSPSGINRGLRTLRRCLRYAANTGTLQRAPHVTLAPNERRRERVLTAAESEAYLTACPQPWRDCAIMILDEGCRPGEIFALGWQDVNFAANVFRIVAGKTSAARRTLPMTDRVRALLLARHVAAGKPEHGWVFPRTSDPANHIGDGSTKGQHRKALDDSKVVDFVPYTLRHTALTGLAAKTGDNAFLLAQIAG